MFFLNLRKVLTFQYIKTKLQYEVTNPENIFGACLGFSIFFFLLDYGILCLLIFIVYFNIYTLLYVLIYLKAPKIPVESVMTLGVYWNTVIFFFILLEIPDFKLRFLLIPCLIQSIIVFQKP